jgi:hypothetical protein
MDDKQLYYFNKGYNDQCSRYFWQKAEYPKKYQKFYRLGQIKAYDENKAEKPWFL